MKALTTSAESKAKALSPTIHALQLGGLVSPSAIARELNEREIPTRLGSKWHPGSVKLLLRRLERLERFSRTAVGADQGN
jgi:hypothetical protein